MPVAAPRPCNHPGCKAYQAHKGYCAQHQKDRRAYDDKRGNSSERGYTYQWRKYRQQYLRAHPLCVLCMTRHVVTPATVVDHIIPHKGNMTLFWDDKNHQGLCESCHNRKTLAEDMGSWPTQQLSMGIDGDCRQASSPAMKKQRGASKV